MFFKLNYYLLFLVSFVLLSCRTIPKYPGNIDDKHKIRLTILHFNDIESSLLGPGKGYENIGGILRFSKILNKMRKVSTETSDLTLVLSAGNTLKPGSILNLSLKKGTPFYESMAIDSLGSSFTCPGSHDFDYGETVFYDYASTLQNAKLIGTNIQFENSKNFKLLKKEKIYFKSYVFTKKEIKIGIIGILTPELNSIASLNNLKIIKTLTKTIQNTISNFETQGVNKVILLSSLNGIKNDEKIIKETSGIDLVISGGGKELLANEYTNLISDSYPITENIYGNYPMLLINNHKQLVPVVSTSGRLQYLGVLQIVFDSKGMIVSVSPTSSPIPIINAKDIKTPNDSIIKKQIILPVAKKLSTSSPLIGHAYINLPFYPKKICSIETLLSDFVADSLKFLLKNKLNSSNKLSAVSILPASAISTGIKVGPLSEMDLIKVVSFNNFLTVLNNVNPMKLKLFLELALSDLKSTKISSNNLFPLISGMKIVYNPSHSIGHRLKNIQLDNGDYILKEYKIIKNAPNVNIITTITHPLIKQLTNVKQKNIGVPLAYALKLYITTPIAKGGLGTVLKPSLYRASNMKRIMITRE
jgi:5'-nucleotidase